MIMEKGGKIMLTEAVWLALRWFLVGVMIAATVGIMVLAGPVEACLGCRPDPYPGAGTCGTCPTQPPARP